MVKRTRNGILCIEGDWDESLRQHKTVRPIFQLLRDSIHVPFIYRNVATRVEFAHVVQEWAKHKYKTHNILYLGFHGHYGSLRMSTSEVVSVDELSNWIHGKGEGRMVHFGACSTMASRKHMERFLIDSNCEAVSGYTKDVDWLKSTIFELYYFHLLVEKSLRSRNLLKSTFPAFEKDHVMRYLSKKLGFEMLC